MVGSALLWWRAGALTSWPQTLRTTEEEGAHFREKEGHKELAVTSSWAYDLRAEADCGGGRGVPRMGREGRPGR